MERLSAFGSHSVDGPALARQAERWLRVGEYVAHGANVQHATSVSAAGELTRCTNAFEPSPAVQS